MRTQENLTALVTELERNCGDLYAACRTVGISVTFVNRWKKDDVKVAEALAEAERVGGMQLYTVAKTRAVDGVDEPVFYKGEICGYKTNYSDGLLNKLLEAKVDGFQKGDGGGNTFNGPTQINIMPRASNYQEWLLMRSDTAKAAVGELPAPVADNDIIDAAFSVIEQSPLAGLGL